MKRSQTFAKWVAVGAVVGCGAVLVACSHSSKKAASTDTNASSSTSGSTSAPVSSSASSGSSLTPARSSVAALSTVPSVAGVTLSPTPLKSTASFGGGIDVHVKDIAYGTVTDSGPGVISGQPAVTFTLEIDNHSNAALSVNTVQVDVTYGSDDTPAVPSNSQSTTPFKGSIEAGKSATGTYAFAIPVPEQRDVSMTVWYAQGKPTVVLTGSAH